MRSRSLVMSAINSKIDWDKEKARYCEKVLNLVESRGGYTDLRQHIKVERVFTPLNWERKAPVHLGVTFNLAHSLGQMLYLRRHNEFEEFKDFYLVGGGTHPAGGLPSIFESGGSRPT